MNNKEYIAELSQRTGYSQDDTQHMVRSVVEAIALMFDKGDGVSVRGFGTFMLKKRMERIVVSPATGQRLLVPPKIVVDFRAQQSTNVPRRKADAEPFDVADVLSQKYELSAEQSIRFADAMFDVVRSELSYNPLASVKIKGFGTFRLTAVNGRARAAERMPSVDDGTGLMGRMTFLPEVALRDRVNRPFLQFETVVMSDGVDFSKIDADAEEADVEHTGLDDVESDEKESDEVEVADAEAGETESKEAVVGEAELDGNDTEARSGEGAGHTEVSEGLHEDVGTQKTLGDDEKPQEAVRGGIIVQPPVCKQRSPRTAYCLLLLSFLMLVAIGVGLYIVYARIEERSAAIENIERHIAQRHDKDSLDSIVARADTIVAHVDSAKEARDESAARAVEAKADKERAMENTATAPPDYDYDPRVRTGAYVIVGTDRVVKVRAGQTLEGISRTYLGKDMECYVEVYNRCTAVQPGDHLKIPKLKLKRKR